MKTIQARHAISFDQVSKLRITNVFNLEQNLFILEIVLNDGSIHKFENQRGTVKIYKSLKAIFTDYFNITGTKTIPFELIRTSNHIII